MKIETDDFCLQIDRVADSRWLMVAGDSESLECFKDSVELAGYSKDAEERTELIEVRDGAEVVGYKVYDGTLSMWLDSEVLNYL